MVKVGRGKTIEAMCVAVRRYDVHSHCTEPFEEIGGSSGGSVLPDEFVDEDVNLSSASVAVAI